MRINDQRGSAGSLIEHRQRNHLAGANGLTPLGTKLKLTESTALQIMKPTRLARSVHFRAVSADDRSSAAPPTAPTQKH
jgi:hypothetical protein